MKHPKIFLAITAAILAAVGIASAKMHKLFAPYKRCFFLHYFTNLYTIPVMMYTRADPGDAASAAFTKYNDGPNGKPCYSNPGYQD